MSASRSPAPWRIAAAAAFSRIVAAPLVPGNRVRLLRDAAENYPAWLDAIDSARHWIHFESYIVHEDAIGWQFAERLMERARSGVHVRLIYDWLGALGHASRRFWRRLREAGVEVRRSISWRPNRDRCWRGGGAGWRYFGPALNIAARVAAHARGGQILCTRGVAVVIRGASDMRCAALGTMRFKNVSKPVEVFEIVSEEHTVAVVDPVCHMHVEPATAPARLPFSGRTYYFCSFQCAEAFTKNPSAYLEP